MLRLLVLVLVVALVAVIAVKVFRVLRGGASAQPEAPPASLEDAQLVRCGSCGAYVPRDDALVVADGFRCGEPRCRESI